MYSAILHCDIQAPIFIVWPHIVLASYDKDQVYIANQNPDFGNKSIVKAGKKPSTLKNFYEFAAACLSGELVGRMPSEQQVVGSIPARFQCFCIFS